MKLFIFTTCLLLLASAAWAEDASPKSATVGGGVTNPWRSPYRTALVEPSDHTLLRP